VYTISPILKNIIINDAAWAKDADARLIIRGTHINIFLFCGSTFIANKHGLR
jgi:hypothetical protein